MHLGQVPEEEYPSGLLVQYGSDSVPGEYANVFHSRGKQQPNLPMVLKGCDRQVLTDWVEQGAAQVEEPKAAEAWGTCLQSQHSGGPGRRFKSSRPV